MNSVKLQDTKSKLKNMLHFYTWINYWIKKLRKWYHYNCIKENKIFRNQFNQGDERQCIENYKTLLKDPEEDTNKRKDILCYGLEESVLFKCPYYPEQVTDLVHPIKIPMKFFKEIEQTILKSLGSHHSLQWAKEALRENKAGGWPHCLGLQTIL